MRSLRRWLENQQYIKWLGTAIYWTRTHTVDRYHLIDISRQGDYKWGWVDRCDAMYLACFKLLVEYVEEEGPFEIIDWDSDDAHKHAASEIKALYKWWKTERAAAKATLEAIPVEEKTDGTFGFEGPNWTAYLKMSDDLEKRDDEMLDRLMKIRKFLWT